MIIRLYRAVFARALMLSETLRQLALRGFYAWAVLVSPVALADGDLADMGVRVGEGAKTGITVTLTVVQLVGLCSFIGGLIALKSMGKRPDIRPWAVALAIVGGLLLMGVPEIIKRGQSQMGMTPVNIG